MGSMPQNGTYHPQSAAQSLRERLAQPGIIICPGVYDGITARLALRHEFECLYMTGAGTSMSRLGKSDLGIANMSDMVANAGMIASLDRKVPLLADADTGYGGPLMVARTVREYIVSGVAALHLEDQVIAKRCGHLTGQQLVDDKTWVARIRAAWLAREEMRATTGGDIVIVARTDALQSMGYEAAIKRLKLAVSAGAEVAFLEGMTTVEQCRKVCEDMKPTPCLINMVGGGVTPDMSAQEAEDLGFKMIIYPMATSAPVSEYVDYAMRALKKNRKIEVSELIKTGGVRYLFNICGMQEDIAFDTEAGGAAFSKTI